MFTHGTAGAAVAGVIMIIIGVMFAAAAFLDMIMLIKVDFTGVTSTVSSFLDSSYMLY
jgi:hypothetical protein